MELSVVNFLSKKLHLRYLTRFWMHHWQWCKSCIKFMLLLYFSKSSYQIFKIHPIGSFRSVDNAVLSISFSHILGWKFLSTHVLKLPGCHFNANFSVVETGKAVKQIPTKTLHNLNRSSCAKYCLVHSTCYYFNLQSATGTCELLEF